MFSPCLKLFTSISKKSSQNVRLFDEQNCTVKTHARKLCILLPGKGRGRLDPDQTVPAAELATLFLHAFRRFARIGGQEADLAEGLEADLAEGQDDLAAGQFDLFDPHPPSIWRTLAYSCSSKN